MRARISSRSCSAVSTTSCGCKCNGSAILIIARSCCAIRSRQNARPTSGRDGAETNVLSVTGKRWSNAACVVNASYCYFSRAIETSPAVIATAARAARALQRIARGNGDRVRATPPDANKHLLGRANHTDERRGSLPPLHDVPESLVRLAIRLRHDRNLRSAAFDSGQLLAQRSARSVGWLRLLHGRLLPFRPRHQPVAEDDPSRN